MKQCKLILRDAVNVRFEGLDISVRKRMSEELKFMVPEARHMPQFKLGRWDGTVSFCSVAGNTYFNLLDRLLPILDEEQINIEVEDRRPPIDYTITDISDMMFADKTWGEGHALAGEPIVMRDYQVDAIQTFADNFQSVQQIATGAGKTLLTAALSYLIEPYGRSIIIVPNKSLVTQTEDDYRSIGLDVGVFYGDRKEWGRKHTICTWQSLSVFAKKKRDDDMPSIMDFINGVTCVIIDEVHSAKATELKNLLCGPFSHVPIRWGLTGTVPKAQHESVSLLASIGPVVGQIKAVELQERDVLARCHVEIVQLMDDKLSFKDYDTEHKFLVEDDERLHQIAEMIEGWSQSGNTLVLVDRIPTGEALQELLSDASFVYGKTKTKNRKEEYLSIQTALNKTIIATYGVAAVGINIPRIFNVVLLEAGKSFVRVIQSIGRGLRKSQDKGAVTIYDVCSTLTFSNRHLSKRKEYYREAEYPFSLTKVPRKH